MTPRHLLSTALPLTLLLASCDAFNAGYEAGHKSVMDERAAEIHADILTLDTHVDIPLDYMDVVDPGGETEAQVDLPKMVEGGLDSAFFIVYTPQTELSDAAYAEASKIAETRYAAIANLVATYSDRIGLARTADEVDSLVASGRLAVLIGMENAFPLGASTNDVAMWADRGIRYMGLTHMGANQFGDSSNLKPWETDVNANGGLTELGRELIAALNDHGIMVDISHAGDQTALQAMALSRVPVIASHSGVDGVSDNARNMSDELLDTLRDTGGVVQLVALGSYVKTPTPEQSAAATALRANTDLDEAARDAEWDRIGAMAPGATVSDYVDHIDYAVKRIGIDHVGIASDFDGGGGIIGWQDATETPEVTAELLRRDYSRDDIAKIWGGNLLRVLRATEAGRTLP